MRDKLSVDVQIGITERRIIVGVQKCPLIAVFVPANKLTK